MVNWGPVGPKAMIAEGKEPLWKTLLSHRSCRKRANSYLESESGKPHHTYRKKTEPFMTPFFQLGINNGLLSNFSPRAISQSPTSRALIGLFLQPLETVNNLQCNHANDSRSPEDHKFHPFWPRKFHLSHLLPCPPVSVKSKPGMGS